ncbi:N-acetylmuramoyl-L-alanine amidase [Nostoc linckia z18]|jgi:N-acetylmuramoyl-L-alanine amidase|uniref:N-acetylmuramoyl-L-alanine amidase n=3 Tax=Nostoc TaxID=1177 RepID=A0A9Q6EJK4_NOSLI|nr:MULTISPECIES: N-acetylmuramoyl-L-alanine amidase [Nostoc]MBL1202897.1 N-acetylmuramoyl-L-alanine amidase [Nostoc sp. GBBB01]MDZ8014263.1 N-acetylmuramoyl-L-alanine amidase [Nostoc sp. ZfuVER08]PHK44609.1 N-acetylmuramoyl-L-alanine amidase [Nostoc linckia z16]MBC1239494.1 N-acetylmuramoyl-L-alanine amidase [Nostoc sp. 2RC]MBD2611683.1 N-acetylmuramoyl-L-alanine amidase [Nostoc punctiforme FACHB-252]
MKFGIDMGHNCPPDTGATGIKQEDTLTKAVGTYLIQKLKAAGHTAIDCTPTSASSVTDSLRQRANKANANNVNIFVSIHFNKFNTQANGTEIYAISNASQGIAQSVLKEIVKLGFYNRGVKNTGFFVLKNTQMPAILIECCFCDSQKDMGIFDAEKMAEAIKDGLIGESDEVHVKHDKKYLLEITTKTVLKPSTEQSSDLPKESLVDIEPGDYPVLDVRFEENHYWVKWPDKSKGNRDEHFVFAGYSKVIEKS